MATLAIATEDEADVREGARGAGPLGELREGGRRGQGPGVPGEERGMCAPSAGARARSPDRDGGVRYSEPNVILRARSPVVPKIIEAPAACGAVPLTYGAPPRAALTAFPGAGRITPSPPAEGAGGTGHRLGARAPAPAARRPPTGSAEANPGRAGQVAGQVSEREAELPGPGKPGLAEARAVPSASAPPGAGAPGRVTMQVVASGSSVQSSGPPCALSHLALIE